MRKNFQNSLTYCFVLFLLTSAGCSRYAAVSPMAYEYSKALYSVCNRHDESRLESVAKQIEVAHEQAELSDIEVQWLGEIINTAQAGDWQGATKNSRDLMEAQVVHN